MVFGFGNEPRRQIRMPPANSKKNPPQLRTFCAMICGTVLAVGCSGNTAVAPSASGVDASLATNESTLGSARFSALLDCASVSGGPIDDLQQQNAAFTVLGKDGGSADLLFHRSDRVAGAADGPGVTAELSLPLHQEGPVYSSMCWILR